MARTRIAGRPRVNRSHSETMSGAASAATRSIQGNPNQIAPSRIGPRMAAEMMRSSRPRYRSPRAAGASAADAAIASFTPAKLGDRLLQMLLAEIRPQRVDEHQLGIGALPEQEIADALFATRADQQIRVGHAGSQQLLLEARLVDAIGRELTGSDTTRQAPRRLQDLVARAVVDADVDVDAAVGARHLLRFADVTHDVGRQALAIADDAQARAVLVQFLELVAQVVAQQAHQVVDLVDRP